MFLAAGAKHLVGSLWRVNDRATRELMTEFYGRLTGGPGTDVPKALSEAGRALRARRDHPLFWGAFSAFGP